MQKWNIFKLLAATGLLILSSTAWSFTISDGGGGTIDVGGIDIWQASQFTSPSNTLTASAETTWVSSIAGYNVSLNQSTSNPGTSQTLEDSSVYALALATNPDYFLLQLNSTNFTEYAVFKNTYALNYAVFDVSALAPYGCDFTLYGVDQVNEYSGTTNTVPEPGSIALLGIGLIGLGLLSRRAKKA